MDAPSQLLQLLDHPHRRSGQLAGQVSEWVRAYPYCQPLRVSAWLQHRPAGAGADETTQDGYLSMAAVHTYRRQVLQYLASRPAEGGPAPTYRPLTDIPPETSDSLSLAQEQAATIDQFLTRLSAGQIRMTPGSRAEAPPAAPASAQEEDATPALIVAEGMIAVYAAQGRLDRAEEVTEALIAQDPSRHAYFVDLLARAKVSPAGPADNAPTLDSHT